MEDVELTDDDVVGPLDLPATTLRGVVTRGGPQGCHRVLRIRQVRVLGPLDLDHISQEVSLDFQECDFDSGLSLRGARLAGLALRDCTIRDGLAMRGAQVGGDLDLSGTTIWPRRQEVRGNEVDYIALDARLAQVSGDVRLDARSRALGGLDLSSASIAGTLWGIGATIKNASGHSIIGDHLRVAGGGIHLRGLAASGVIRLHEAEVAGHVSLTGARLQGQDSPKGEALNLDGLRAAAVYLDEGFCGEGTTRLTGAVIRGPLSCAGGRFLAGQGAALLATRAEVAASVSMTRAPQDGGEPFHAEGLVSFERATVNGSLDCTGAELHGGSLTYASWSPGPERTAVAMTCVGAQVGRLVLKDVQGRPGLHVDLRSCAARILDDDLTSLSGLRLHVEGLTYDAIAQDAPLDLRLRRDWLRRHLSTYSPQPYDALAAVYRASGYSDRATRVLIEKQRRRRRALRAIAPPLARTTSTAAARKRRSALRVVQLVAWPVRALWSRILRYTIGYGYTPLLAVPWLAFALTGVSLVLSCLHPDYILPVKRAGHPRTEFNPVLYAADLLLPVVNFGQRALWVPRDQAVWFVAACMLLGWALALVVVAGLTGVFKRE